MNNTEKIKNIRQAVDDHEYGRCPYCAGALTDGFIKKKPVRVCRNHPDILVIRLEDYMDVIRHIIKYSNLMKDKMKFKNLSEF